MASDSGTTRAHRVSNGGSSGTVSEATRWVLTLITAAGLAVDAYVHWHLAASFDSLVGTSSPHISQGQLFRLEAVLALVAMVLVLATRRRFAALVALLVAAGGVGAVLLYGLVDVGGLGPLPDMYDPTWSTEKVISVIAEGLAALGALGLLVLPPIASRTGTRALDD
jgi:hypothetical protein